MKIHWISRSALAIAAMTLVLIATPDAYASKEKFVRDKPHVNVGDEQSENVEANDKRDEKGKKKGAKRDAKKRAKEVAKNRSKDDEDVAEKTNKSETARAKRPN